MILTGRNSKTKEWENSFKILETKKKQNKWC